MKSKYLSPSCTTTQGFLRSIILDFSRSNYFFIPNDLSDILLKEKYHNFDSFIEKYSLSEQIIIKEYFEYLEENELIYEFEKSNFAELDFTFDIHNRINNTILEISNKNICNVKQSLVDSYSNIDCENIEIIFFININEKELCEILDLFEYSTIRSININLSYSQKIIDILSEIRCKYLRLNQIVFFASNENKIYHIGDNNSLNVFETKQIFTPNNYCGVIYPNYFACNLPHFTESQCHNTCLNRKISIDVNGEIKNCPSMKKSFGNIKDTTLEEALEKPGFKDLWTIKKDDIEVCKDCEFRHICTDCRAFIKDPENIYSQPAKCPYNPYIAKWEGQEGYITVEESLKAMNSEQLIVNS